MASDKYMHPYIIIEIEIQNIFIILKIFCVALFSQIISLKTITIDMVGFFFFIVFNFT